MDNHHAQSTLGTQDIPRPPPPKKIRKYTAHKTKMENKTDIMIKNGGARNYNNLK